MAEIGRYIALSTAHLDAESIRALDDRSSARVVAHPTEYGWLVYVPSETTDPPQGTTTLQRIFAFARREQAKYVLFDCDAEEDDTIRVFDYDREYSVAMEEESAHPARPQSSYQPPAEE